MTPPAVRDATPPPYGFAALTAAVVLAIYVATLGPTIAFWDTAEYTAAAKVLGIPHPPGNPLFVILAHVWGWLPLAATYAERINLFAAVTSALASGLWFLVADRWLRSIVPVRPLRLAAAFAGVLVGATLWTVWNQSTVNEKVYTVSLLSMALVMWIAVHWGDDAPGPQRDRWLILIAYLLTLSSTNHMMGVLAAPAVAVYVLWTDWRAAIRPWVLLLGWMVVIAVSGVWTEMVGMSETGILVALVTAGLFGYAFWSDRRNPMLWLGIVAVVVGISLNYLFLPIRAAQFPPINEGEPTTWAALLDVLSRAQYSKPPVTERQADFLSQLGNYWQYWSWQFGRDLGSLTPLATAVFTTLGLVGLWTLLRRDRRAGVAALAMLVTLTLALVFYLNFKYGFSQHPDQPDLPREVRERDYFFICSFSYFGTLVAVGFGTVMRALVDSLLTVRGAATEARAWWMATPLLLLALVPLLGNRQSASRAHETTPRVWAIDLLQSVEPYAILITAGDNDTFPLWYAQEVEGVRRDVLLANLSLLNTEWHLRQVRRRRPDQFDPTTAAPLWRSTDGSGAVSSADTSVSPGPWRYPDGPAFAMSEAELDAMPEVARTPAQRVLRLGDSLELEITSDYLTRSDLAVIFLIRDNLGKRPIYFAWSTADFPDRTFALTPWLVTEGFARRLNPTPVRPGGPIVLSPSMGFVDVERTRRLLWEQYHWQDVARPRPRGWVDTPSVSILQLYAVVYGGMADVFRQVGDTALAARADSVADAVSAALRPPNPRRAASRP
jgi:VanZ family protein